MALAQSRSLTKLKSLHLDANGIGGEGMTALAEAPGLRKLENLYLTYNRMEPDGLEAIQNSDRLKGLKEFKSDAPLDDDD